MEDKAKRLDNLKTLAQLLRFQVYLDHVMRFHGICSFIKHSCKAGTVSV